jgi:hypothetical protein
VGAINCCTNWYLFRLGGAAVLLKAYVYYWQGRLMGGFNFGIPLSFDGVTITPEQIQNAVAARTGQPAPTLTQAVTQAPAPTPAPAYTGTAAIDLTGDPDMDRQILDARATQDYRTNQAKTQERVASGELPSDFVYGMPGGKPGVLEIGINAEGTKGPDYQQIAYNTPEEYREAYNLKLSTPTPRESWTINTRPELAALAGGLLSLAIPGVATGIVGSILGPAVGASSAGAAAALGGASGGLGALGTSALTAGVGGALGAGLAAATDRDPLMGALGGALGGGLGAGTQGATALSSLSAAGPSVIEQVFSEQDYRDGGVIPEQPFETQAPIVPPTEAGGGGATPAPAPAPTPAPAPAPAPAPGPDVDPEQPYRYEGDGRFINVLTGEIINRIVPDTFVIGDFYGLPQNVETNVPEPAPPTPAPEPVPPEEEEVVDVFVPPDLVLDTTAPDTFEPEPVPEPVEAPVTPVEPVQPTPVPTPASPVEQPVEPVTEPVQQPTEEPAPQPDTGTDESVAVGGEGTGTGEGSGEGEGEGEGDGSGGGAGTGMMAAAAGAAFEPQWSELFKYTTLTPYQKKALAPYVDYIAQARGMLS